MGMSILLLINESPLHRLTARNLGHVDDGGFHETGPHTYEWTFFRRESRGHYKLTSGTVVHSREDGALKLCALVCEAARSETPTTHGGNDGD